MNVLLVDDDPDILEVITFAVESEVKASFFYASSVNEGIEIIEKSEKIDLVICDYNMPGKTGGDLYVYLLENNIDIPYALCSTSRLKDHSEFNEKKLLLGEITKPDILEGVERILAELNKKGISVSSAFDYSKVRLKLLRICRELPCHVFLKISEEKYIKVFNKSDLFSEEDETKYLKKGINSLYISSCDSEYIVEQSFKMLSLVLEDKTMPATKKSLKLNSTILSIAENFGLNEKVMKVANKAVLSVLAVANSDRNLKSIVSEILQEEDSYLAKHSTVLAYVSIRILSELPWDSYETRNKLAVASLFHDVSLGQLDIDIDEDVELASSGPSENFKKHSFLSAEILKGFSQIPEAVDRIIQEHHEKPDGSGFPRGLTGEHIKPLSAIFIFSHDLVDKILQSRNHGEELSMENLRKLVSSEIYSEGTFLKCYNIFKDLSLF